MPLELGRRPLSRSAIAALAAAGLLAGTASCSTSDSAQAGQPASVQPAHSAQPVTASRETSSAAKQATSGTRAVPAKASAPSHWRPRVGLTWQWQLTQPVNTSVKASVYDIDMFLNSASVVRKLHSQHRRVICYIDVGSWESYRPDAHKFPASVKGKSDGWPGERWLDIRKLSVLRPIITARFRECAKKGFDGVEPDLMDGYSNDTGFRITAADQLRYNRWLARLAHSMGLAVGLKGDPAQAAKLVTSFDYTINEQCMQYHECGLLRPFIAAHKPVFHVEYYLSKAKFCAKAKKMHFSSMRKHLNLGVWRDVC